MCIQEKELNFHIPIVKGKQILASKIFFTDAIVNYSLADTPTVLFV